MAGLFGKSFIPRLSTKSTGRVDNFVRNFLRTRSIVLRAVPIADCVPGEDCSFRRSFNGLDDVSRPGTNAVLARIVPWRRVHK
jgi:hypothetical protein